MERAARRRKTHASRALRQRGLSHGAREPAKERQHAALCRPCDDLVDRALLLDGELPQRVAREDARDRDEPKQDGERHAVGPAGEARKLSREAVVDEEGAERAVEDDFEDVACRERACEERKLRRWVEQGQRVRAGVGS